MGTLGYRVSFLELPASNCKQKQRRNEYRWIGDLMLIYVLRFRQPFIAPDSKPLPSVATTLIRRLLAAKPLVQSVLVQTPLNSDPAGHGRSHLETGVSTRFSPQPLTRISHKRIHLGHRLNQRRHILSVIIPTLRLLRFIL